MPFYVSLKENTDIFMDFLRKILSAIDLLQEKRIVHCDLKPDNILLQFDGQKITSLKLIDFGSGFSFDQPYKMRMSTPEYLAPECLEYTLRSLGY